MRAVPLPCPLAATVTVTNTVTVPNTVTVTMTLGSSTTQTSLTITETHQRGRSFSTIPGMLTTPSSQETTLSTVAGPNDTHHGLDITLPAPNSYE
ncbi:hypothetical protein B0J18DRAFT_464946 [Chaetomium sp. MPI-SDFR-AT-0129]|nr:hypothetical protein B0J18DRAFT_464946 [Chaetomium sp. MPI-SDFR-AT-0129]